MKHIQTYKELNEGVFQNLVMAGLLTLNVLGAKASTISHKLKSGFEMVIDNKGKGYSILTGKEVKNKIQSAVPQHLQKGETIKGDYTPEEWFVDGQKYICISVNAGSVGEAKAAANQKFKQVSRNENFIVSGFYVIQLEDGSYLIFGQTKNS